MRTLFLALLIGVTACAKRAETPVADPAAVLAEARARRVPFALRGAFSVTLEREGAELGTRGGLVLHPPDRFRVEVLGPVGTPLVILASDGVALHVWNAQDQVFYRGDDAGAVLEELTGGAVTLADVVRLLTGTLPLPDAPVRSATADGRDVSVVLEGGEGVTVLAQIDGRSALLQEIAVRRALTRLLTLTYGDPTRVGRQVLPGLIELEVPALPLTAKVEMESWDELGQIPEVFSLSPPSGAAVEDLVASLKAAAEEAGRPRP